MADFSVGLHVYSLKLRTKGKNHRIVPFGTSTEGELLRRAVELLINLHTSPTIEGSIIPRPWYFENKKTDGFSTYGLIKYGSSGFESTIVDGKTRDVMYDKKATDLDVIPIYYHFWVPDSGDQAFLAIQTIGLRSCVNKVQDALSKSVRMLSDRHVVDQNPISLADTKTFGNAPVTTLSFVQREVSSDAASNAIFENQVFDVGYTLKSQPKENLGTFSQVKQKLFGRTSDDQIEINNDSYSEATASVKIGGKIRRVVILGVSKNSGKIDITEHVDCDLTGHPKFDSIHEETKNVLKDIMA
ncbi:hypothetical protein [Pacificibacter sp. AS14]|uniref:hypothetical protein n=1 Tax=Pacificibacter sp. AS14 TaxID=3135785 RepID=UPI00317C32ED